MLREAAFETLQEEGDALVIHIPFGAPAASNQHFWAPLASTTEPKKTLGWVRFERRTVVSSKVLFEATELRSACGESPSPEPSLQVSIQLQLGVP